ncbi:uncharacterized protein LOC133856971 [Alnus glutinosa]|uniref:uncharacterized protein LOC133856971 n=1 Tax=Alnus glutinosa TaxID=3517 RepID=UPI002D794409|nr:uncharacterized protein LOC133856971 [Alnus glutinosa]
MDAIHGIDQKASRFWMRVHAEYDEHKKSTFFERSVNSLTNRWSTIQVATNKFCGCIAQIEARHPSGVTELDKVFWWDAGKGCAGGYELIVQHKDWLNRILN